MIQKLTIKHKFPSLNEVILEARGNRYGSNNLKQVLTDMVILECRAQKIKPVKSAKFKFIWTETNKRRNKDNIASAHKFLFDGLVKAGIIKNDGWSEVVGDLVDSFKIGDVDSVEVLIDSND